MQRPRAAVGDERELARVVAALDARRARSAPAMFSLTIARMPSAASSTEPRPIASAIVCTAARAASTSSCHLAAEQPRRQVAERRRSRRSRSAPRRRCPYGGRAGLGARRLRADAERLRQLRHVGDRAAARADGVHVDATGTLIRKWLIDVSRPIVGSPFWHSATSVDVPPMSNVRMSSKPALRAT